MRCDEIEREVACFIDGELAAPELREVESHLTGCAQCRDFVALERQLKQVLRRAVPCPAPGALLGRVRSSLADCPPPVEKGSGSGRPGFLRWAGGAAGVLVPIAAALALVLGYVETVEPLLTESVVRHQRNLPLEVTGNPEAVQSWFDGKVPFAVPALKLEPIASLRGGRLSHLGSREAAQLQYERAGQRFSIFVFDPQGLRLRAPRRQMIGNREVFLEDTSGYHVAVFRDRGLGYAITGNLDESDVIRLISAAVGAQP